MPSERWTLPLCMMLDALLSSQTQRKHSRYTGTFDALRTILRTEGVAGLYRGFAVNALSLFGGQVYITVFEYMKGLQPAERPEALRTFCAAAVAVFMSQLIANPIDVVSQTVMAESGAPARAAAAAATSQQPPQQRGAVLRVVRSLLAERGALGLYRGYWASIAQNVPSSGIWWTAYAILRRASKGVIPTTLPEQQQRWLTRVSETASGFGAGACVAVLGCPLDVIRVRVQVKGQGVLATARTLVAEEGAAGLMKGVAARFWMLAPNGAVIMSAYELVKRLALREELREHFDTPHPLGW